MNQRIISIKCQDHAGVVNRITALFFSRDLNIHSLTVCETEDEQVREIFIETRYDAKKVGYIVKLLSKLIDIIDVEDITDNIKISREHTMIRIKTDINTFNLGFNDIHATFLDVKGEWVYLEITDTVHNTSKTIEKLKELGEVIYVRSGSLYLQ